MRDTQTMILKQIKDEQFKLKKEIRSWLGPLILFSLIMIAFPLSIDLMNIGLAELFLNIIIITILVTNYLSIDDVFFEDFYDGNNRTIFNQRFKSLRICGMQVDNYRINENFATNFDIYCFCNSLQS